MKRSISTLTVIFAVMLIGVASYAAQKVVPWKAPVAATDLQNPIDLSQESIDHGQQIFSRQCLACHGESGKGDGPAGKYLGTALPDFSNGAIHSQSDGELFWKITTGKAPMPTFEEILSDEERWQVVRYLRTLREDGHSSNK